MTTQQSSSLIDNDASCFVQQLKNIDSIHFGNEGAVSSVSIIESYFIRKLLGSIFNKFPVPIRLWEFRRTYIGVLFQTGVCTSYTYPASCSIRDLSVRGYDS
jgi:hypothetical protein